jgi:hypothetical protein
MKSFVFLLVFFFQAIVSMGQSDETVLNGYKLVYLVPMEYTDGSSDKYGVGSLVKEKLQLLGLQIVESSAVPNGMSNRNVYS